MAQTERREYERTHPWLTFDIGLERMSPRVWMALGEAQSKCEHISGVPLLPTIAEELHIIYLTKGIQATTAIEGNTLTQKEVRDRIAGKKTLPKSRAYLGTEIDNVVHACRQILSSIELDGGSAISPYEICDFNGIVLSNLSLEADVAPGQFRRHSVGVGGYRCAPWQDCEYLVGRLCEWLNSPTFQAPPELEVAYGLIKAIVAHIYFVWIHPFGDGNGRTARLLEVKFLLEAGVPSAAAHLLSNHYNQTRSEYYRQLDGTSKSGGDLVPFISYALQGFVDELRDQLQLVRRQQLSIAWESYVYNKFKRQKTPADRRQLKIALALPAYEVVRKSDVRNLTPALAADYASKTEKTVSRDMNALVGLGLVERVDDGYRARTEVLAAFLPRKRKERVSEVREGPPAEPDEHAGQLVLPV